MTLRTKHRYSQKLSAKTRIIATAFIPFMLFMISLSLHWLIKFLIQLYGRLQREALIVETQYIVFVFLAALPIFALVTISAIVAAYTGKKFDPPKGSALFKFQNLMFTVAFKTLIYLVPAAVIIITLILLAKGYSPCGKLYIPGTTRQIYWVNDDRACFKPDHYINDNWPCKIVNGKDVCIPVDGR